MQNKYYKAILLIILIVNAHVRIVLRGFTSLCLQILKILYILILNNIKI